MTQPGTQLKAILMMMVLRPFSETFCRLLLYTIILLYDDDDNDDDDADDANDNDDETTTIMIICNMLFHVHFL